MFEFMLELMFEFIFEFARFVFAIIELPLFAAGAPQPVIKLAIDTIVKARITVSFIWFS